MRVLIADDDRDSAESLAVLLRLVAETPLTADVTFDGRQAVEIATRTSPDVVILDIEMPVMNGFDAAAAIKQAFGTAAPLLIAVSGNLVRADFAEAGSVFDHALRKPIDAFRLLDLMRERGRR